VSAKRVAALDWVAVARDLDQQGASVIRELLASSECEELARLYPAMKGSAAGS
jgi:hypothetical protein